MLQELNVEGYAVVAKLRVRFQHGLNLLTGETGSGKSIVVGALSLLLGARAATEVIRPGCRRARIAGVFEVTETPALTVLLSESGVELEQGELIVEREVLDNGKSRAYVNGRLVTLAFLHSLAPLLGDIHGQHEQQSLFSARTQLDMLDAFAGTADDSAKVAGIYRAWRRADARLRELRGNEQERLRLSDLYRFQHREIGEAKLDPAEVEQLTLRRDVLGNLARVEENATLAYDVLYDSSVSATTQLAAAQKALKDLIALDPSLGSLKERLEGARANIEDAAFEIRSYVDRLEPNPDALAAIEDRLALIEGLKRKYGATVEEVLAYGREVATRLEELQSSDSAIAETEQQRQEAAGQYEALAKSLSERRHKAASKLQSQIEKELASLAMQKARFEIAFEEPAEGAAGWSASGSDRVRFLVSANPGQPPRPMAQVASGGELSRITLALKSCLVSTFGKRRKTDAPRTLVFDEIDSGVGGRVAEALGRRLKKLSDTHQVLCVTHLPQIAGFADAHYFVEKEERKSETFASVAELSDSQRVDELARMLSGAEVTSTAVKHAHQMLKANRLKAG